VRRVIPLAGLDPVPLIDRAVHTRDQISTLSPGNLGLELRGFGNVTDGQPRRDQLADHLLREGYLDDEVDARRAAKSLLESVINMLDGEDGEIARW
jgi:hypothetical protein